MIKFMGNPRNATNSKFRKVLNFFSSIGLLIFGLFAIITVISISEHLSNSINSITEIAKSLIIGSATVLGFTFIVISAFSLNPAQKESIKQQPHARDFMESLLTMGTSFVYVIILSISILIISGLPQEFTFLDNIDLEFLHVEVHSKDFLILNFTGLVLALFFGLWNLIKVFRSLIKYFEFDSKTG
jgi:hypothetical protein